MAKNKEIVLIFIAALLLRILFLSPWLEDWDSVQFALALHHYSVINHQPHPPGYPIYVILGRILNFILQNDRLSLTTLSVFFGAGSVIFVYLITKYLFNKTTAILASIFFILLPVQWTLSEVALTNIPGLFFLLLLTYLLIIWCNKPRKIIFLCTLFGLMLGIRFTEISIIIGLLGFVLIRTKSIRLIVYSGFAFVLGTLLWLIPVIFSTGAPKFIESYTWMANYILKHDTLLGKSLSLTNLLQKRGINLWYLLQNGYTAIFILLSAIAFVWIILNRKHWKNQGVQFFTVWMLAYFIPLLFVFNLEVTRYTLPLTPPLAVLLAYFLSLLIKKKKLLLLIPVFTYIILFNQGFSQVTRLKKALPPTIAPVLFVKENFNPKNTIIISTFTYRQFQYYAPEFQSFYASAETPKIDISNKVVIIDFLELQNRFPTSKSHQIIEEKTFIGDKDIFNRINKVNLYVLKPK